MRNLRTALALVLVFVLAVPAVSPAVTEFGNPAISRLWISTPSNGDTFVCTGWYLSKLTVNKSWRDGSWLPDWTDNDRGVSWVVSAGHCAMAYTIYRGVETWSKGAINWLAVYNINPNVTHKTIDVAVGKVPDLRAPEDRKFLSVATADAEPGDVVYIHGFPLGVERIEVGQVYAVRNPVYPGAVHIRVDGHENGLWYGASGSPVLNRAGQVVGVLWGLSFADDPSELPDPNRPPVVTQWGRRDVKWALMTPVSELRQVLRHLGVHGYHGE